MPPRPLPARVYGDEELARLLKRATELQRADPVTSASGGLTLAELEQIAGEVGIDPRYLRAAAQELDAGDARGEGTIVSREATLAGELSESGLQQLAEALQSTSREHGDVSLVGRSLAWRAESANKKRSTRVVVRSRDGHTWLRVEEDFSEEAKQIWALAFSGGAGVGAAVALPAAIAVLGSTAAGIIAGPLATLAIAGLGAREIVRRVRSGRQRSVDALFERSRREIGALLARALPGPTGATGAALPGGL